MQGTVDRRRTVRESRQHQFTVGEAFRSREGQIRAERTVCQRCCPRAFVCSGDVNDAEQRALIALAPAGKEEIVATAGILQNTHQL